MSSLRYLIFGCFLLSVSKFADGLECYQCNNCNSPFKPEGILKLNSNKTNAFCSKTTARNVATTRGITQTVKKTM
ncbi:hypothetical protein I4U23_004896 [Adineta vaga]|nr:hypothetical protein I4U23_004896 [Adineta vaga]